MNALPLLALTAAASYLVGAIPFGYLVARWRGVDILRHGSGNIGATNVGRVLGRRFGLLVFLLDFAKGALPVLAAGGWPSAAAELPPDGLRVTAGVAAFLGHLFPVYLRFRGGKGVATAAGVVAVLLPGPVLAALLAWAVVFATTRYVSLASLAAAALLCALRLGFTPEPWSPERRVVTAFCFLAAALVCLRHHANIRRLVRGTENRFRDTPAMLLLGKTLHVLALGLWFGTVVFFTLVGLVLFDTFRAEALKEPRAPWFPRWEVRAPEDRLGDRLGRDLPAEQGSRAAGAAVGPLFPWFYAIQAACGVVALATALGWWNHPGRVHRPRAALLLAALLAVGVGWWLERAVEARRGPRNQATDAVRVNPAPSRADVEQAEAARADFGRWHGYSLLDHFAVLLLVSVAMALAAQLPAPAGAPQPQPVREEAPPAPAVV